MSYYRAIDNVEQLRIFRKRREAFIAKATVGDLVRTYPIMHACERLDKEELWHYRHAQTAIDDSKTHYMNAIYAMTPIRSRINHNPHFIPREFYER